MARIFTIIVLVALTAGGLHGAVVTFDSLAFGDDPFSYTEAGLTFEVSPVGHPLNDHLVSYDNDIGFTDNGTPSLGIHSLCCASSAIVTYLGNIPFTPISFYVDSSNTDPTFQGRFRSNNGDVLDITGTMAGTTVFFPVAFQSIASLEWLADSGDFTGSFTIDNFEFIGGNAEIPEPSTVSIVGVATILMWVARRTIQPRSE